MKADIIHKIKELCVVSEGPNKLMSYKSFSGSSEYSSGGDFFCAVSTPCYHVPFFRQLIDQGAE